MAAHKETIEEKVAKILKKKCKFLLELQQEVIDPAWNTKARAWNFKWTQTPDGIKLLRAALNFEKLKDNQQQEINRIFTKVEQILIDKQTPYTGKGSRLQSTVAFYKDAKDRLDAILNLKELPAEQDKEATPSLIGVRLA